MTDSGEQAPIVVGVDGSPSAQDALDWAAAEASTRDRPLRIVHGFIWPLMHVAVGPSPIGPDDGGFRAQAERLLADAVARAMAAAPGIKVTSELEVGAGPAALLRQARDAELLVVGSRGMGGFLGLLVGSTGVAVAAHAPCPVVVVHPRPDDHQPTPAPGRVVVGADGSELSAAAIEFAFQAAAHRRVVLTALRAWTPPLSVSPSLEVPFDRIEAAEHHTLLETLESARRTFPSVEVETRLVRDDHPGRALIEASVGADLVVVGSRGRGGFTGLLLGSVSQSVLEHAQCPVAVVRAHRDKRDRERGSYAA